MLHLKRPANSFWQGVFSFQHNDYFGESQYEFGVNEILLKTNACTN